MNNEQDRGLMGRRLAGDGEGMLFVYSKVASRILRKFRRLDFFQFAQASNESVGGTVVRQGGL